MIQIAAAADDEIGLQLLGGLMQHALWFTASNDCGQRRPRLLLKPLELFLCQAKKKFAERRALFRVGAPCAWNGVHQLQLAMIRLRELGGPADDTDLPRIDIHGAQQPPATVCIRGRDFRSVNTGPDWAVDVV